MDNVKCFNIDGESLVLDKTLVSFNDTPIFFICRDDERNYYAVLCTNVEELEYIVVKSTIKMIYEMLVQKIDMRELFLSVSCFWYVQTGASIEEDEVQLLSCENMDLEVLPFSGAKYEPINKSDADYIETITAEYLDNRNFVSMDYLNGMEDIFSDIPEDIALETAQPIVQYVDFGPLIDGQFPGLKKVFEHSWDDGRSPIRYSGQVETQKQVPVKEVCEREIAVETDGHWAEAA